MTSMRQLRLLRAVVAIGGITFISFMLSSQSSIVYASCPDNVQSCSSNYRVNEVFFGTGGQLCDLSNGTGKSANYCAKSAVGETGVGNVKGTSYQAQAGFETDREPSLTVIVNSAATPNLGVLTPGTTATDTATFSVKSYLASGGYQVVSASNPPSNGNHNLQSPLTPTASNTSAEQFGINLAYNNGCTGLPTFGAAPVQVPDSTFSFGAATSNYNTACKFMYNKGDVIASSSKSSGETDYTISYIFNTTSVTPDGTYTFNHILVATSTF